MEAQGLGGVASGRLFQEHDQVEIVDALVDGAAAGPHVVAQEGQGAALAVGHLEHLGQGVQVQVESPEAGPLATVLERHPELSFERVALGGGVLAQLEQADLDLCALDIERRGPGTAAAAFRSALLFPLEPEPGLDEGVLAAEDFEADLLHPLRVVVEGEPAAGAGLEAHPQIGIAAVGEGRHHPGVGVVPAQLEPVLVALARKLVGPVGAAVRSGESPQKLPVGGAQNHPGELLVQDLELGLEHEAPELIHLEGIGHRHPEPALALEDQAGERPGGGGLLEPEHAALETPLGHIPDDRQSTLGQRNRRGRVAPLLETLVVGEPIPAGERRGGCRGEQAGQQGESQRAPPADPHHRLS